MRQVLNLDEIDRGKVGPGLYLNMFKIYNLQKELSSDQQRNLTDPYPVCSSQCLHTLIEDKKWTPEDERLYELEMCGCDSAEGNDEERVYA